MFIPPMPNGLKLTMLACLLTAASGAKALSVNPVADAFVTTGPSNNLSGNNYGGAGALGISDASASKGAFASVIRFDLATIKSGFDATFGAGLWAVQSITLQLTTTNPNNAIFNSQSTGQFSVVWMQNDSWVEGTGSPGSPTVAGITYTSLPTFLGAGDQALGTFTFDNTIAGGDGFHTNYALGLASGILADIQSGGLASFEFAAASSGASYLFNSRSVGDVTRRPILTVTAAAAVPEASEWFVMGIGCMALALFRTLRRRHEG